MYGDKTGGRQLGTLNKKTKELEELIKNKYPDFNPILSMIEISRNPETPLNVRYSCLKEVAQYLFPKKKALELSSDGDTTEIPEIVFKIVGTKGNRYNDISSLKTQNNT